MDSSIKLFVAFVMILASLQASSGDFLEKVEVQIINKLPGAPLLTVHCKSGDDDLGVHQIPADSFWQFSFKPSFFESTLFFCSFQWPGAFYHFDVYDQKRDENRCHLCHWTILPTGPCLYNICEKWNP
ncbi:hypothetical protein EUGRSUZ_H03232 [Eucalyptus grandis]|uniref:Uncharacterized protein n=2 Tax=Eucalyptus grandis TaxID=71139 RepID=A0ACC3K444_EUCGR|nr:hypothetical protein EUGRSUZ_H03232 [Eucalyptus grandis]